MTKKITAPDWDNEGPKFQDISGAFLEITSLSSSNGKSFFGSEEFQIQESVFYHKYSYLCYLKKAALMVLPACRPTRKMGRFLMVGPEVRKLFCSRGAESAYVVWQRLQEFDLMHHRTVNGIRYTGAKPVTIKQLQADFPGHSEDWVRKQLKTIDEVVGLFYESRRDDLTSEQLGNAYFPNLIYVPDERAFADVDEAVECLEELMDHAVKKPKDYDPDLGMYQ